MAGWSSIPSWRLSESRKRPESAASAFGSLSPPLLKALLPRRLIWLFWLLALASFVGVALFPVSNDLTRTVGVLLLLIIWLGFAALLWRRRLLRILIVVLPIAFGVFLGLPVRSHVDPATLRQDVTTAVRRYKGVPYYWGGESFKGIDCSGLVRRGLVDSLFCRGFRSCDPGLVRYSLWLWWHDCTAKDLGQEYRQMTVHILDTPSINALDDSRILPGDLAVTQEGVHVMEYLGDHMWIEADPSEGSVVAAQAPTERILWFRLPFKIMRWTILCDPPGKSSEAK